MNDRKSTNQELSEEIAALKRRIEELECSEGVRKKVEEELRVSRDRLTRAEIVSRCGHWEFDLSTASVYASEGARSIYGIADGHWTIQEIQKIPLPEYRGLLDEALKALVQESRPYNVEFRIRRPDTGEIIDIHSVAEYDPEKNLVFGVIQDTTERKRVEAELREAQTRYRLLFDHAPYGIVIIDPLTHRCVEFNERASAQLGYTPEEFAQITLSDIEVVESLEETRKRVEAVICRGRVDFETMQRTKQGEIRNVHVTAQMTEISGHRLYHCVWRDITEQKQAEEALRQSEELYRTLVAASPDSISVADLSGQVTLSSQKAHEVFGVPEGHEKGRSILEWVSQEDQPRAEAAMRQLLGTGEFQSAEFVLRKDDGTTFDAEIHAAPLRSSSGAIRGAIIITRDATERKNLQAQLLQAQKMEAIGTLAGGVAHDFNNILMAIMGYAGLMETTMSENDPLRSYVREISNCTNKAANVTRSLLAFGRKQAMELQPHSINMILRDLEKLLKRLVPEDVTLTVSLNEDAIVMADMTQIDQVLINLVSNAKDAMPKGGTLHVESKAVQLGREFKQVHGFGEPGGYAMISVTDTGSGMDEAIRKKIFEPFFTTKEVGKGTGLGLSIVYGIIKQHAGYITVSSQPGRGTTFDIYLPVVKMAVAEAGRDLPRAQGGNETILLAEDNADVRTITGTILRTAGYSVVEAEDGQDAVRKYMEHPARINLLVLDVVMPCKNGKEVYEQIRGINPSIRALFMSGYTGDVVLDKGVEDTVVDYISKPLSADTLLKKVREVLEK